jgi:hypothetical protein
MHPNSTQLPFPLPLFLCLPHPPSSSHLGFRVGEMGPVGVVTMVAACPTACPTTALSVPRSAHLPDPSVSPPRCPNRERASAFRASMCNVRPFLFLFLSPSPPSLPDPPLPSFGSGGVFLDGSPLPRAMGSSASASAVVTPRSH